MDPIRVPLGGGTAAFIEVTEENYISLRKAYLKAFNSNADTFSWEGIELVTLFAAYCLQYMEMSPLITEAVKAEDDPDE